MMNIVNNIELLTKMVDDNFLKELNNIQDKSSSAFSSFNTIVENRDVFSTEESFDNFMNQIGLSMQRKGGLK